MIKKQKDDIREEYKEIRRQMSADEKQKRDAAICTAAENLVSFRYAEYVLLYAAAADEIDVSAIAEAAFAKGKKVLFPRCDKKTHTMTYHEVKSLDELIPDSYNDIAEPPEENPIYDAQRDTGGAVCFVPGLVYDKAGYRLGYGKGFYDRYLSAFSGCTIGVVYSDYILNEVPRGRFDVSVDILLTEKGVRVTKDPKKTHPGKA
ncbi:MAG: 5-formyltetrahydrofolate cyclo-ligase [Clostridia bacterium]|nr:5-formyltetrahydrofolate cyclo-ligase [Clostridia bacterium]MBO5258640.1 5-formyltetrahydrofolate cyclo-ligase [Clostridia bacterium]MBP3293121.1 5-formyltetrahydrofolate cyclo-ligase [Clostridia bacterium]